MRKTRLSLLVATFTLLVASPAFAQGFYVGGGLGSSLYGSEVETIDPRTEIDENAFAWKLFGGFSPSRFLGVEGGYRHFGTAETTIGSSTWKSSTKGWDVEALGRVQIAIIDIFGKAGAMFWNQDVTIFGVKSSDSGTDFLWGLGAGVHLGPIGIRGEWESVTMGGPDSLSMLSLSGTLGF